MTRRAITCTDGLIEWSSGRPSGVLPPPSPRKKWTRRGVAEWLVEQLGEPTPTLVGIDHGFSLPLRYTSRSIGSNPTGWPSYTISSAIGRRTATTPTSNSSATASVPMA